MSKVPKSVRAMFGTHCQRAAERWEIRALIKASLMPRALASNNSVGQRSDSMNRPAAGRQ